MRVRINNREYGIRYWYIDGQKNSKVIDTNKSVDKAGTGCEISLVDVDEKEVIVNYFAKLYYKDEFDKIIGRKYAFAGAVKEFTDSKKERFEFWKKFHQTHKSLNRN